MKESDPPLYSSDKFLHDKTLETYRSMISYTQSGQNMSLLINGFGVISLLTLVGNIGSIATSSKFNLSVSALKISIIIFASGIVLVALSCMTAYVAQRYTFIMNTGYGRRDSRLLMHPVWGILTVAFLFMSIAAFACGAFYAAIFMIRAA